MARVGFIIFSYHYIIRIKKAIIKGRGNVKPFILNVLLEAM